MKAVTNLLEKLKSLQREIRGGSASMVHPSSKLAYTLKRIDLDSTIDLINRLKHPDELENDAEEYKKLESSVMKLGNDLREAEEMEHGIMNACVIFCEILKGDASINDIISDIKEYVAGVMASLDNGDSKFGYNIANGYVTRGGETNYDLPRGVRMDRWIWTSDLIDALENPSSDHTKSLRVTDKVGDEKLFTKCQIMFEYPNPVTKKPTSITIN